MLITSKSTYEASLPIDLRNFSRPEALRAVNRNRYLQSGTISIAMVTETAATMKKEFKWI